MTKEALLSQAKHILGLIHYEDIFKFGGLPPQECVKDEDIDYVKGFIENLNDYLVTIDNNKIIEEINNIYFFDGKRISKERVKKLIKFIEMI